MLSNGQPIAPYDAWGNDVLWWLDRMVRTRAPLVERMTLIWHDWFATSNEGVNSQRLMIAQNRTQRSLCLGSFPSLLAAMTTDPAMLIWLSGGESTKAAPNENYAREMQELFTLGAGEGLWRARRARTRPGADGLDLQLERRHRRSPSDSASTRPCTTRASRSSTGAGGASAGATASVSCSTIPITPPIS